MGLFKRWNCLAGRFILRRRRGVSKDGPRTRTLSEREKDRARGARRGVLGRNEEENPSKQ